MRTLLDTWKDKWKNSVATHSAEQLALAVANGTIIPQAADDSGNGMLLAAPAVKTYLSSSSPESPVINPVITAVPSQAAPAQIATVDASGNIIGLSQNINGSLTPSIIPATIQALTNTSTNLGLTPTATTPSVSSDTIIICVAGGIAIIGILALIFKH